VLPGGVKRMIVKMGAEPAMEMPAMAGMVKVPESDIEQVKPIGKETIVTPAGTFVCDHYQVNGQDAWINADVSPYGLVKADGPNGTILLQKKLSGVSTRITETPQRIPGMDQLFGGAGAPQLPAGLLKGLQDQD
jgi:hypothetical protein